MASGGPPRIRPPKKLPSSEIIREALEKDYASCVYKLQALVAKLELLENIMECDHQWLDSYGAGWICQKCYFTSRQE